MAGAPAPTAILDTMKHVLVLGLAAATVVGTAVLGGCSSSKSAKDTADHTDHSTTASAPADTSTPASAAAPATAGAQPGTGHVTLDNAELGPAANVSCQTAAGVVTISVESTPKTTVVVTDEATPAVRSVTIGELGSPGPSVAYVDGVSGKTEATRTGGTFTVTGTGTGARADAPDQPVELPFEIAATCP